MILGYVSHLLVVDIVLFFADSALGCHESNHPSDGNPSNKSQDVSLKSKKGNLLVVQEVMSANHQSRLGTMNVFKNLMANVCLRCFRLYLRLSSRN